MSWISKLRNTLRPARLDEDLRDEMRDHIDRRTEDLQLKGQDGEDAHRQASVLFGNASVLREQSREFRLWSSLEGSLQDVRYAWRGMLRSPAVAATAVLSLALAIG